MTRSPSPKRLWRSRPAAGALSADGETAAVGYDDGTIEVLRMDGKRQPLVFDTRGQSIDQIFLSPDARRLAAIDATNTLWLADLDSASFLLTRTFDAPPTLVRFFPDSRRVLLGNARGTVSAVDPLWLRRLPDVSDLTEWARAAGLGAVSDEDRRRYHLQDIATEPRTDLAELKPFPMPPRLNDPVPGPEAEKCDQMAANLFDRERRAAGVIFDQFDAEAARGPCALALARYPDDPQTRYQNARIKDRLDDRDGAFVDYVEVSKIGYAVAMRGVARLLDEGEAKGHGDIGTSAEWMEKAARAGDPWSLALKGAMIALDPTIPDRVAQALTVFAATGMANRAEQAMNIGFWVRRTAKGENVMKTELFYELLGLNFNAAIRDAPRLENARSPTFARDMIRDIVHALPAADVVVAYRAAQAWRYEGPAAP